MYFSRYNIFAKIKNSESYYLVNILTGNADILSAEKAAEISSGSFTDTDEYIEKGYLADEKLEKKLFNEKYLDFIEKRERDEVQVFFVPWYTCNFACSYCYQSGYDNSPDRLTTEIIDSFYKYVQNQFAGRRKYITIFGGEPLLPGGKAGDTMKYMLDKAKEYNLDTAIVTNGYTLTGYVDLLKNYRIREVQVTLDGTEDIHNKRRFLHNGGPTFTQIAEGIDAALQNNISINLRVVLDKENINNLPELARYCISKGWTKDPLFKTQFGRNYELHYCQSSRGRLFSRLEFYETIYSLINDYPEIIEFHRPAFSISKYLFDKGELPEPLFDDCTGCKTEWAFDYTGNIYSCTATVGKPDSSLGTFYPEVTRNDFSIREWEDRDVTSIPECKTCSLQLACGGGCAAVAFNKTGKLHSPDCRPVKELISMGLSVYFNEETA